MDQRQVTRTFYLLSGLYTLAASLIWSVNTLFLLDAGLSIAEAFAANAVFSAGMVIFEIPTGVVADTLGRRVSYLLSVAVLAGATLLYLLMWSTGGGLIAFAVASLFMGLGFTFYSGALEAWLVDALQAAGGGTNLDRVFARAQQVTGAAMLVGTIGGGFLGQLSLAVPFVLRAALLVVLLGLAAGWMVEQGFTPRDLTWRSYPREALEQGRVALAYGWSRAGLRPLMLTSAVRSGFLYWAFYAAQPYFLELLGRDTVWVVGLITAGFSLATMGGNQIVDWLARRSRRRTTMLLAALPVTAAASIVLGATDDFGVALTAFLVIGASLGVADPVHRAYLHTVIPGSYRATVVSFDVMIGNGGAVGGQVGLGAVSQRASFSAGYVTGGLGLLIALPLLWAVRRVGGPGDAMIGLETEPGSCAAEGLPAITQVETRVPSVVGDQAGLDG